MAVQNKHVKFQLDCGSTVNILLTKDYKKLFNDKELQVQLKPSNQALVMFNKTKTKPAGKRKITIVNPKNKKWYNLEFVVVNGNVQLFLGSEAIQRMKLITVNKVNIHNDNISKIHAKTENQSTESTVVSKQMLEKQYPDVFKGEGKLPGELKLDIDKSVTTVKLATRKVPVAPKDKIKNELDTLVEKDIISQVDVPNDWISSMVVVTKWSGKI